MRLTEQQEAEIEVARAQRSPTARPTVAALEATLFEAIPVLDHGFVRVIDYMGDDAAIVQAARVSYGRGTRRVSEDAGLIRYLMRHRHSTPFEMCEIKYHVKLPIFVARQWIRHRTANVNEYSARYSILDREFYLPEPEHLAAQSSVNRQGRGDVLAGEEAAHVLDLLREDATRCYDHYAEMLNEDASGAAVDPSRQGLARELARMNLTLNAYTQWWHGRSTCTTCATFSRCVPTCTRSTKSAPTPKRCWARWLRGCRWRIRRSSTTGWARSRCRRRCWRWCGGSWRGSQWSRRTAV